MAEELSFAELIQRVRAGDKVAADRLVRLYEKQVRRVARIRLAEAHLTSYLDSMDICQSVSASFFKRMARPDRPYEVATPAQLISLLATMARNKVKDKVTRVHTIKRDRTREQTGLGEGIEIPARQTRPSEVFANKELYAKAWAALTEAERAIWQLREDGMEWAEIAAKLGGSADSVRKKFDRACERVKKQLHEGSER